MITPNPITTVEQLEQAGDLGRCELLRGELRMMSPGGWRHGRIAARVARFLDEFVESRHLGAVGSAETGFIIEREPDTVRAPDASFVRAGRLHLSEDAGYFPGPPDLAVEVISPGDSASEVLDKVQQWLSAGCESVWVADPDKRTIAVYRSDRPVRVWRDGESLIDEPLLPGFALVVDEVFRV